ncbi:MAG: hypothetical protein EBR82_77370, partial [Caulobacteraceae bacterium]|nr:hypothetical protein [Caulobacteraceae bacterium]
MPFTFPASPTIGDTSTQNGRTYRWSGYAWEIVSTYTLPIATTSSVGAVQVGTGLSVDASGVLSATATAYTLPTATSSVLGGVKVG